LKGVIFVGTIVLSKPGADHLYAGVNRQDFAVQLPGLKLVLDGCGSTRFPEVGATLFAQLLAEEYVRREREGQDLIEPAEFEDVVRTIFDKLSLLLPTDELKLANLCFTILACFERETEFVVMNCGDGFILASQGENMFQLQLDDGEYPKYFAYNLVSDKDSLVEYRDGVAFTTRRFSKDEYDNVGVATDGLRFVDQLTRPDQYSFYEYLRQGRKGKVAMTINRNSAVFKDDISVAF
jgi:serine/threonine protein phosphatase PrpC